MAAHRGHRIVITTHGSVDSFEVEKRRTRRSILPTCPRRWARHRHWGWAWRLCTPEQGVIVVNGDGSMLMNLGSLVTIAAHPANLFLVIIDNGVYEVTGGQAIPGGAGRTDFPCLGAGAAGIARVHSAFDSVEGWRRGARESGFLPPGPVVIQARGRSPVRTACSFAGRPPMDQQIKRPDAGPWNRQEMIIAEQIGHVDHSHHLMHGVLAREEHR